MIGIFDFIRAKLNLANLTKSRRRL